MVKWGEVYKKIGDIRHRFDTVAHTMVDGCFSPKDPVADMKVIDDLIEALEGDLMELISWRENQ
jgi:hypothetical protein